MVTAKIHIRMAQAKTHIRMHSNPLNRAWDWTSLSDTISRAIMIASEKRVQKQTTEDVSLPLHLRSSILANPSSANGGAHKPHETGGNKKRKAPPNDKPDHKEKEKKTKEKIQDTDKEPKKCIHHPTSTTHTTAQCINKGKTRAQTRAAAITAETQERTHKPAAAASSYPSPQTRQRTGGPIDMSKIQCHTCHQFGHMSRTCTFSAPRGSGVASTSSSSTIPLRGGQAPGRRPITMAQARMARAEALRPRVSFADEQEQQQQDESEEMEEEQHESNSGSRSAR